MCGEAKRGVCGEVEGVIVVRQGVGKGAEKTILINTCESKLRALFLSVIFLAV